MHYSLQRIIRGKPVLRVICAFLAVAFGSTISNAQVPQIPPMQQKLYAPLAGMEGFPGAEVAVINHSQLDESATVTVYSVKGKPYPSKSISLQAGETRRYQIRDFLPEDAANATLGGITMEYYAPPMIIAAQLTLSSFHGHGNLDYLLEDAMEFHSSTLEAVWWEPPQGNSVVVVGNSSERLVDVEIDVDGQKERTWIAPFATLHKRIPSVSASATGNVRYVHVSSATALTGDLQATGFSVSEKDGYFQTVQFLDPASSTEPALYANALHFSNSVNQLVVRNISSSTISISGDLFLLNGKPPANKLSITSQAVAPGATVELRLPSGKKATDMDGAALKLRSSGAEGSFVAAFTSFDPEHQLARYVPFKDIGRHQISTGGYPWRLDGDYESKIYITNVGKVRAAFGGLIRPQGGENYLVDTHYLEVGETALIDVRQIRDQQIADRDGVKLPKDAVIGHFEWSTIFGDGTQRLIGRQEVISQSTGISSSFSCASCSCPNSVSSAWVTPNAPLVLVDGIQSLTAMAGLTNSCSSGSVGSYTIYPGSWNINTPGYFTITPGGATSNMQGTSPGSSYFYTPFLGTQYVFNGQYCFSPPPPQLNPGGTGTTSRQPYRGTPVVDVYSHATTFCATGSAGWDREVVAQVFDTTGTAYTADGVPVSESVQVSTTVNGLGLSHPETGSSQTAYDPSDNLHGTYIDEFFSCSTVCPGSSAETDAVQTITYNGIGLPHTNALVYKCSSTTIDGR